MVVCRAAQEAGAPHREYIYAPINVKPPPPPQYGEGGDLIKWKVKFPYLGVNYQVKSPHSPTL